MVGNDIACDILIRHFRRLGLSVDAKNDEGFTALLMAAKHGNITCAQILLGQGKASHYHRDNKHGMCVEEWLAKKGFTIQDIMPVRHDGKGRSRFVKLANIAAICSGPKKVVDQSGYEDFDYAMNNFHLGKLEDEEQYLSDATTGTEVSMDNYIPRYSEFDMEFASQHFRVYPLHTARPKLKTQATQTRSDGDDDDEEDLAEAKYAPSVASNQMTEITELDNESVIRKTRKGEKRETESRYKSVRATDRINASSQRNDGKDKTGKRLSLPEIDNTSLINRSDGQGSNAERKKSLDVLPEKLIANIDLGDGRRHSIQLHADSARNKVYWTPVSEGVGNGELHPLEYKRTMPSVSDSETSTNDDAPIF